MTKIIYVLASSSLSIKNRINTFINGKVGRSRMMRHVNVLQLITNSKNKPRLFLAKISRASGIIEISKANA